MEGLSSLLTKVEMETRISGVPSSVGGQRITHLFFTDDSPLFCRANVEEWENLSLVLQLYEKALGHQLNAVKTSIFFSKNTGTEFRDFIRTSVGIQITSSFDKYLGLPIMVGRSKNRMFAGICSRVQKKLIEWKVKFFS